MGRIIKRYPEFIAENFENEGLRGFTNKIIGAVKRVFKYGYGFLDAYVAQVKGRRSKTGESGTIPYGVTIYPSDADLKLVDVAAEPKRFEDSTDSINERVVGMEYPDPKTGVIDVGKDELMILLRTAIKHPKQAALMVWGAPGIGKTSLVRLVQKEYGGRMIDVQLTTYAPEDFFLPAMNPATTANVKSRRSTRIPQEWLPLYHETEGEEGNAKANGPDGMGGIIFLDEISRASEAIRNICLKLVLDKELDGGWKIGSKWVVIAASNRTEDDETNTMAFGSALSNRFKQVNFVPTVDSYVKYASGVKNERGGDMFDQRILSFLKWSKGQEFFHKMDPDMSKVFPSPRSWDAAAMAWDDLKHDMEEEGRPVTPTMIERIALAPNIGSEAATAFIAYYILSQKIDLANLPVVYTNPDAAPLPPKVRAGDEQYEMDAAYILAAAIAYEHKDRQLTAQEIENVIKYSVRVNNPTVAMQIMTALIEIHPYLLNVADTTNPLIVAYRNAMGNLFLRKYPGSARDIENLDK